jgi:hypothetical protein
MKYIDSYIFKQYYFAKKLIQIINYYFDKDTPHKDHDEQRYHCEHPNLERKRGSICGIGVLWDNYVNAAIQFAAGLS